MLNAPTAVGRQFVTRAANILVETEQGPAITKSMSLAEEGRITVLTDRDTGAQIRLDDAMVEFIFNELIPDDARKARRIQRHFQVNPVPAGQIQLKPETAHCGSQRMTVEATVTKDGKTTDILVSAMLDKAGEPDMSEITLVY